MIRLASGSSSSSFDWSSPWTWTGIAAYTWIVGESAVHLLRAGPRSRLSWRNWEPKGGWQFWAAFAGLALLYGGGSVLLGPGQTRRVLGAVALVGGAVVAWLLRRYILKPVQDPTAHGSGAGALVWTTLAVVAPVVGAVVAQLQ